MDWGSTIPSHLDLKVQTLKSFDLTEYHSSPQRCNDAHIQYYPISISARINMSIGANLLFNPNG